MRVQILSRNEKLRNDRVRELMSKKKPLLLTGNTDGFEEWSIDDMLSSETKLDPKERILQYENDQTIGQYCDGMTYLEIEQYKNLFQVK